jgi:hypothetical protein
LNANNNSITNVNTITSTTCATQTLTANTFNGSVLGGNSTSGSYYIGASSIPLLYLTNLNNIAIGNNTLNAISSSTPQSNIAIGTDALRYGQPSASAGIGYQALSISNGQFCVGVGHLSGFNHTNGTGCTYLGVSSTASSSSVNNEMALGYQAVGKGVNTIQLGNPSATTLYTPATVRSDTGTLTLNSQGGALNLQSAGTTYASVDANGITSANFNGKLSIVGGSTTSGNLVLCNNGTNTTGNFDLLTDSGQHLRFSGGTGAGSNVLTVGGATNGSIVVPSTAGTITAPTLIASNVSITGNSANFSIRIGDNANVSSGLNNTSVGVLVGRSAGTGQNNTLYGVSVGRAMTSASQNVLIGGACGDAMTSGGSNVAVGIICMNSLTTGSSNTCVGNGSGSSITTGTHNLALGENALNNTSASTTGTYNTAIGHLTMSGVSSGIGNTALGSFAGGTLTSGTYNIYIGYNTQASGVNPTDEIAIGNAQTGKGSNTAIVKCAQDGFYMSGYTAGSSIGITSSGNITSTSDRRVKNSIEYLTKDGNMDIIMRLKPASYKLNQDPFKEKWVGFIAQDLMEVIPNCVDCKKYEYLYEADKDGKPLFNEEGQIIYKKDENGELMPRYKTVDLNEIWTRTVLAVQEQQQTIIHQQTEITDLKAQLALLKSTVDMLVSRI